MRRFLSLVCWLLLAPALSASPPRELELFCVPPNPQVVWLSPAGERNLSLDPYAVHPVYLLPEEANPPFELELRAPGYDSQKVTVSGPANGPWHVPAHPGQFLRLQPHLTRLTVTSDPSGAEVFSGAERLGITGEPIALSLGRMLGPRHTVELRLSLPGYRSERVELAAHDLERSSIGPIRLRPAYPGAGWVLWLSRRPAVAAALLVALLACGVSLFRAARSR